MNQEPVAFVQKPCGHVDVIQTLTRLSSEFVLVSLSPQCWYCRVPITEVWPIHSVVQLALIMAGRPKLEKLALAHRIETTSRQGAKP